MGIDEGDTMRRKYILLFFFVVDVNLTVIHFLNDREGGQEGVNMGEYRVGWEGVRKAGERQEKKG